MGLNATCVHHFPSTKVAYKSFLAHPPSLLDHLLELPQPLEDTEGVFWYLCA